MTTERKKGAPKAVGAAKGTDSNRVEANVPKNGLSDNRKVRNGDATKRAAPPADPGQVVWEQSAGRDLVRFAIREHGGHRFAELRRWYAVGDDWKPGNKGCTFPVQHLEAFMAAVATLRRPDAADRPGEA